MTIKKFLTSVADIDFYDQNDTLLITAKTLIDSAIDVKLGSTEIRGGRGAQLQYIYYHSNAMTITLTDAQFNLAFLGTTVGSGITTGNDVYTSENVTLGVAGAGSVTGTPLAIQSSTIYGWVKLKDGTTERVTFSGSDFTSSGAENDVVCVTYFALNAASRSITVNANVIPTVGRLVLKAQLNSSDVSTNKIGELQIIVPRATLTGNFNLALKTDGVSTTPLSAMALASQDLTNASCQSEPIYAQIIEILDNAFWYSNVFALSISGGSFALTDPATKQLIVYALRTGDLPFVVPDYSDLTFTSDTTGVATVDSAGLVTTVSAGSSLLHVEITSNTAVNDEATVTVS